MADERRGDAATTPDVLTSLSLFDAVATGGYALVIAGEDVGSATAERLIEAAPAGYMTGRLSCHAGGRGDLAPWICLAFDLAPFDPAPAQTRLAAFFEAEEELGRRPLLIAEAADKLEKSELAALRRITSDGARCAVILIGDEGAAERLRAASPAPMAAVLKAAAPAPAATAPPAIRPATDAFAVVARAAAHPPAMSPQPAPRAPASAELQLESEQIAPGKPLRRVRPYGAAAAAAAAAFAAFVIGALTLVDPERRFEAPQVDGMAASAPAEPTATTETRIAKSPPESPPLVEDAAPPPVAPPQAEPSPTEVAAAQAPTEGPAAESDTPVAPPPETGLAEPETGLEPSLRITIHHAPADRDRAGELLAALRRAGFGDVALWPLDAAPEANGVRYFDEADAEAAALLDAAVKSALGPSTRLAPVSRPETEAPRGTLEIWLAG